MTLAFEDGATRQRHCELIAQESLVPSTLTDFTVLVTHSSLPSEMLDADAGNAAQNGGGDIRFSLDPEGQTQLPCDVVVFTTDNNPALAVAEIYVKISSLSGTLNTPIWVHYKTASATVQPTRTHAYGQDNARDTNYVGHYTFQEDPSGAAPQLIDRTVNVRHGTSNGSMTTSDLVAAKVNKGWDFDGTNDWVELTDTLDSVTAETVMFWGDRTSTSVQLVVGKPRTATSDQNMILHAGDNLVYFSVCSGGNANGNVSQADANMHNYCMVYDGSLSGNSNRMKGFIDGVQKTLSFTGTIPATAPNLGAWRIGRDELFSGWSSGLHDSLSLHSVARSADWVTTTYNNENSPSGFLIAQTATGEIAFEDGLSRLHWCYLDVQASKVLGTQTNFSVCITKDCLPDAILDADGGFAALSGGGDVRISRGQTQLAADVIQFATHNTPSSAIVDVRTKTTITSTQNVRLTIWWGASGATLPGEGTTYGKHNVYASQNRFWPMSDNPSGTTFDRTSNSMDLTTSGGLTGNVTGKVGSAIDLDGTDDKLTGTYSGSTSASRTWMAWLEFDDTADNVAIGLGDTVATLALEYVGIWDTVGTANKIGYGRYVGTWQFAEWTTTPTVGVKYHVASTWSSTNGLRLYINGAQQGTNSNTSNLAAAPANLKIGEAHYIGEADFNGKVDDVWMSEAEEWTAGKISTYYNNTNDPATFILDQTPVLGSAGHPTGRRLWGVRFARPVEIGREGVLVA